MAKITIKSESFTPQGEKNAITYERVIVTSEKDQSLSVEIRVPKNELTLVRAIVSRDK